MACIIKKAWDLLWISYKNKSSGYLNVKNESHLELRKYGPYCIMRMCGVINGTLSKSISIFTPADFKIDLLWFMTMLKNIETCSIA